MQYFGRQSKTISSCAFISQKYDWDQYSSLRHPEVSLASEFGYSEDTGKTLYLFLLAHSLSYCRPAMKVHPPTFLSAWTWVAILFNQFCSHFDVFLMYSLRKFFIIISLHMASLLIQGMGRTMLDHREKPPRSDHRRLNEKQDTISIYCLACITQYSSTILVRNAFLNLAEKADSNPGR